MAGELFTALGSEKVRGKGGNLKRFMAAWTLLSNEPTEENLQSLVSFKGVAGIAVVDEARELILASLETHKDDEQTLKLIDEFFKKFPDCDSEEFAAYFSRPPYERSRHTDASRSRRAVPSAKGLHNKKNKSPKEKIFDDNQIAYFLEDWSRAAGDPSDENINFLLAGRYISGLTTIDEVLPVILETLKSSKMDKKKMAQLNRIFASRPELDCTEIATAFGRPAYSVGYRKKNIVAKPTKVKTESSPNTSENLTFEQICAQFKAR